MSLGTTAIREHPPGHAREKSILSWQAWNHLFVKHPSKHNFPPPPPWTGLEDSGYLAGNFFLPSTAKLLKSKESFPRRAEAPRLVGGRFPGQPGPTATPETPVRRAFRRQAARTSRSASPDPSPDRSPPPRVEKPRASGSVPAPSSRGTPRPALPALPGPPTYVTAEGNGSSDEGPISQDWKSVRVKASRQPAAIFEIEDQSRLPPQPGGRNGAGNRGRRRRPLCPDRGRLESWRVRGWGADWLGGRQGRNPARGKGRRRADPLARVGCSAPRLPRLRRHQGRLWKQTWASPPALARSRYLSASDFLPDLFPRLTGEREEAEAGAEEGWRRWGGGGGGCGNGGMAGGETCGRERLRLASPGKSEGGGWGWAAGGLGVRAVGRRRARSSPPYKAERNSQSRRRFAPAARREAGERTQPCGAPGGQPAAQRASTGWRAPAEYLACVFGGYFCTGRNVPPALLQGAESTACLGIVEKWFDNKCRRGLYLHFKAPLSTLPGGTIYLPRSARG